MVAQVNFARLNCCFIHRLCFILLSTSLRSDTTLVYSHSYSAKPHNSTNTDQPKCPRNPPTRDHLAEPPHRPSSRLCSAKHPSQTPQPSSSPSQSCNVACQQRPPSLGAPQTLKIQAGGGHRLYPKGVKRRIWRIEGMRRETWRRVMEGRKSRRFRMEEQKLGS